jgi:hypothetical protein
MRSRRIITIIVFSALAFALGCWFGCQRGSDARLARNNVLSSLRQVGLEFRGGRNDIARFQMVGDAIVTDTNVQGK